MQYIWKFNAISQYMYMYFVKLRFNVFPKEHYYLKQLLYRYFLVFQKLHTSLWTSFYTRASYSRGGTSGSSWKSWLTGFSARCTRGREPRGGTRSFLSGTMLPMSTTFLAPASTSSLSTLLTRERLCLGIKHKIKY